MTAISRDMRLKVQFRVDFEGTAGQNGRILDIGAFDAPRFAPLAHVTASMSVRLNGTAVVMQTYSVIDAISRCNMLDQDYKSVMSTFPSMCDYYQTYAYPAETPGEGVSKDALQSSGAAGLNQEPRGGWAIDSVTNPLYGVGQPGTASVVFTVAESLWLSPFLTTTDCKSSLIGLTSIEINIQLNSNLSRVWSHSDAAAASTLTSAVGHVNAPVALLYQQLSISPLEQVPERLIYSYSQVTPYITNNIPTIPAGGIVTVTSSNITLPNIPRRIYVWCGRSEATKTITTTDTFLGIENANIIFNNLSGILASASQEALYNVSAEAGLNMSFTAWKKYTGGLLVLDITKSLLLDNPSMAPSMSSNLQFQITLTIRNLTNSPYQAQLNILTCADGVLEISNGLVQLQTSVLSVDDVAMVKGQNEVVSFDNASNFYGGRFRRMTGGSFFSKVRDAASAANQFAQRTGVASKLLASTGNPNAALAARALGYGDADGGAIIGGRRVSRSALISRIAK